MFRIKHLIPTAAVLIATAGVLAPAAQARADHGFPRFAPAANSVAIAKAVPAPAPRPRVRGCVARRRPRHAARQPRHVEGRDRPDRRHVRRHRLGVPGRMGAIAVVLILMIAGDQLINRRRGELAT